MWHRVVTTLRATEQRAGKNITASAAVVDWQSVNITEECGKPDPNA